MTSLRYVDEFRVNWRALTSAAIGLATGSSMNSYTASLFAPSLLHEFGWSRATFSLIGMNGFLALVSMPLAGRLADVIGVRRTALIGVIGVCCCFLAYSFMSGSFCEYVAISTVKTMIGAATTSVVYSRLVVERFDNGRGLALAIAISGPAVVTAIGTPFLSDIIAVQGWRVGFRILGAFALVGGMLALSIMPRSRAKPSQHGASSSSGVREVYSMLLRSRTFWIIIVAMLLCNLPQSLSSYHLKLLLLAKGSSSEASAYILSLYAVGVIVGRFICGIALDKWPVHIVCAVVMSIPGLGLLTFASHIDAMSMLALAVLVMGFSQGAEGDVAAYLVYRRFDISIYGSVLGIVSAAIVSAGALGAGLLSLILGLTGEYTSFLLFTSVTVLAGSALFLLLDRNREISVPVRTPS